MSSPRPTNPLSEYSESPTLSLPLVPKPHSSSASSTNPLSIPLSLPFSQPHSQSQSYSPSPNLSPRDNSSPQPSDANVTELLKKVLAPTPTTEPTTTNPITNTITTSETTPTITTTTTTITTTTSDGKTSTTLTETESDLKEGQLSKQMLIKKEEYTQKHRQTSSAPLQRPLLGMPQAHSQSTNNAAILVRPLRGLNQASGVSASSSESTPGRSATPLSTDRAQRLRQEIENRKASRRTSETQQQMLAGPGPSSNYVPRLSPRKHLGVVANPIPSQPICRSGSKLAYTEDDSLDELAEYMISEYSASRMFGETVEEISAKIQEVIGKLRTNHIVTAEQISALRVGDYWTLGILIPIEMKIHILEWLNIKRFGLDYCAADCP
eukprot:TRINITY_DN3908_c0_g1_i1.p2 TRINITY_DN3908_c0_g1~~TRINITY_DN3908_c0_g1_i1.p2  ORF type:complete len:381 (+),score=67.36 TRINITY_DN3908_c0_g1_i1:1429-2571(+)